MQILQGLKSFSFFLDLAKESFRLGDFATSGAIISALESSDVQVFKLFNFSFLKFFSIFYFMFSFVLSLFLLSFLSAFFPSLF